MNYGLSSAEQLSDFLSAVGFGFFIAVLYYAIVFIREIIGKKKWLIITQDIIFCIITSFLCFIFMQIYTDGVVRLDLLAASAFGFFVFVFSAGKFWGSIRKKAVTAVRNFFTVFFSPLIFTYKAIRKIFSAIKNTASKTGNKIKSTVEFKKKNRAEAKNNKKTTHDNNEKAKKVKRNKKKLNKLS